MSEYDEDMDSLGVDDVEVAEHMEDDEAAASRSDAPTPDVDDVVDDDEDDEEEEEEPVGGDDDDDDDTYFERGSAPGKRSRASLRAEQRRRRYSSETGAADRVRDAAWSCPRRRTDARVDGECRSRSSASLRFTRVSSWVTSQRTRTVPEL